MDDFVEKVPMLSNFLPLKGKTNFHEMMVEVREPEIGTVPTLNENPPRHAAYEFFVVGPSELSCMNQIDQIVMHAAELDAKALVVWHRGPPREERPKRWMTIVSAMYLLPDNYYYRFVGFEGKVTFVNAEKLV